MSRLYKSDIIRLFKQEVRNTADLHAFIERYNISDNMLKSLHYDNVIDYCYTCKSYHVKLNKVDWPISNVYECDACVERRNKIEKFKKEIL